MHSGHDATGSTLSVGAARKRFALLVLASMGVVFGDIGTSPLYGFQGAVTAAAHGAVAETEILGITSLIIIDFDARTTFGYAMNKMGSGTVGDARGFSMIMDMWQALAA